MRKFVCFHLKHMNYLDNFVFILHVRGMDRSGGGAG